MAWKLIPNQEYRAGRADSNTEGSEQRFDQMDLIVPELQAIRPSGALLPEECNTIAGREFQSRNYSYVFDIFPS